MQVIGIESTLLEQLLSGEKTIEVRLGKPAYIKLRLGDELELREDVWEGDHIVNQIHGRGHIKITQLLYFETLEELFSAVSFKLVLPDTESKTDAIQRLRQFYSEADEYEYGVMAISFTLL